MDLSGGFEDFEPEDLTLFVGNIPLHFTEDDVAKLFGRIVPVVGVNLKIGVRPNSQYAFVQLESFEDCLSAIEEFDHHPAFKLNVRFAERRRPQAQNAPEVRRTPCSLCGDPASLFCNRCGVIYCSPVCQKFDWPSHRPNCVSPGTLQPFPPIAKQAPPNPPATMNQNTRSFGGGGADGTSSSSNGYQRPPDPNKVNPATTTAHQPRNGNSNAFGESPNPRPAPTAMVGGAKAKENLNSGGRNFPSGTQNRPNVRGDAQGREGNREEELAELLPLVLPKTGKFRVTVVHVVNPQEIWVQLDRNTAALEDISINLMKCQGNVLRSPQVGDYCLAPYSDGTLNRGLIEGVRGQQAKVFYVDFGNSSVVELSGLRTLGAQLRRQACQAAKIGLAGIVGDFRHLTTSDIDSLVEFVMNTEEDSDILLLDVELINQEINGVPQVILSDLEGLVINEVLPQLIPALSQDQPEPKSIPMDSEAQLAAEQQPESSKGELPSPGRQENAKPELGADDVPPANLSSKVEPVITQSEEKAFVLDDSQTPTNEASNVASQVDDAPPVPKTSKMQSLLQDLHSKATHKQLGNIVDDGKPLPNAPNGQTDVPPGPISTDIDTVTQNLHSVAIAQESQDTPIFEAPPLKAQDDVPPAPKMSETGNLPNSNDFEKADEALNKKIVMLPSMARVKLDRPDYSVSLVSAPRIPEIAVQIFSTVIVNALKAVQKALINCELEPVLKRVPVVGEVLSAKFDDGDWFRAAVDEVRLQQKEVDVTYVDYGNSASVKFQDLRELPEAAIQRPICCHKVKLDDVPENCFTNRQVVALIAENIDVAFDMKVVDASVSPPLVDLDNSETGTSLATTVREILSPKAKPSFRPPRMLPTGRRLQTAPASTPQSPSPTLDSFLCDTPLNHPIPPVVEESTVPTPEIPEETQPPKLMIGIQNDVVKQELQEAELEKPVMEIKPEETVIEAPLEVKNSEPEVKSPKDTVVDEPVKRFWHTECQFSLPSQGRDVELMVNRADDPSQVFLTLPKEEYLQKVDELAPQMAAYCETTAADPTYCPESGEIVVAYCEEYQDWSRAFIVYEEEEFDLFQVVFADFGNQEQVPLAKIRPIPERFMELPLLAATCHLKGLDNASEEVAQKVKELLPQDSFVVGHILGCHEAYYEVEIPSVVEELQKAGLM